MEEIHNKKKGKPSWYKGQKNQSLDEVVDNNNFEDAEKYRKIGGVQRPSEEE